MELKDYQMITYAQLNRYMELIRALALDLIDNMDLRCMTQGELAIMFFLFVSDLLDTEGVQVSMVVPVKWCL